MKKIIMFTVIVMVSALTFAEINTSELEAFRGSVSEIIEKINDGNSDAALNMIAKLRDAISQVEAELRGLDFRGAVQALYGPLKIPEGVYKVHFKYSNGGVYKYDIEGNFKDNLIGSRNDSVYSTSIYKSSGEEMF